MKKIVFCFSAIFFFCYLAQSQDLILKGKIKCILKDPNTTKGAENVVVVPSFLPSRATLTVSQPSGYFEINTGLPLSKLEDKTVTVYAISNCNNCEKMERRVFISEDQDRQNKSDSKRYVTLKDWMLNANCKKAEYKPSRADSVLRQVIKLSDQDLDKVSGSTALVGAPTFLNFLTTLTTVAGPINVGFFRINRLLEGKINYGKFLFASPLFHSTNTGFNFSPARDLSEAVFWNPSAIALSNKLGNVSFLSNLKNNAKLSGHYRLNEKLSLGGGFIYTKQDEFRKVVYNDSNGNDLDSDSTLMNLKEFSGHINLAYKYTNSLSVGLSIKSIWQDFNIPNTLTIDNDLIRTFADSSVSKQNIDIDISATYKVNNALQVGVTLMNIAGSEFHGDAFVPDEPNIQVVNQRSLGLGIAYKWQRFNVGTDLLFADGGLYDAALGINYVPFNNALISAGVALKQLSLSLAFRIKHFRIAYINDNNFLINEKRKAKSSIFNGNIYGGFVFDLN